MASPLTYGKSAERQINKEIRSGAISDDVFGLHYRDFVRPTGTFIHGVVDKLRYIFLIPNDSTLNALDLVAISWEYLFRRPPGMCAPCWVPIYDCIKKSSVGRPRIVDCMLQQAGRRENTTVYQGTLMARVSPFFLIGLALLDGATLQVSETHQKNVVLQLTGVRTGK